MVAQATARNRRAGGRGRVDLRLGTASTAPMGRRPLRRHLLGEQRPPVAIARRRPRRSASDVESHRASCRSPSMPGRIGHALDRGDSNRPWRDHIVATFEATGYHLTASREARARSGGALYFLAQRRLTVVAQSVTTTPAGATTPPPASRRRRRSPARRRRSPRRHRPADGSARRRCRSTAGAGARAAS